MFQKIIFTIIIPSLFLVMASLLFLPATFAFAQNNTVPLKWYQKPEDAKELKKINNSSFTTQGFLDDIGDSILSFILDKIYSVNLDLLDQIPNETPAPLKQVGKLDKDYTPWHLEFATTELSLSAKGGIGILSAKGTSTIQAYWRRQNKNKLKHNNEDNFKTATENSLNPKNAPSQTENVLAMDINPDQDEKSLIQSVEPMARAALATGKIKNELVFRNELQKTTKEFYYLTHNLFISNESVWWLNGIRFDLVVDGSGRIIANPLINVGGEIRLRFDFRRIKNNKISKTVAPPTHSPTILASDLEYLRKEMQSFITAMASDLEAGFDEGDTTKGLQAYNIRIAVAFTAGGNIGIIKGSAGAWAHLNFSRDVAPPKVNSPKMKIFASNFQTKIDPSPLYVIEANPPQTHMEFAKLNQIPYETSSNKQNVTYHVDREAFRNGLTQAANIGMFFADNGIKVVSSQWKLWQLRTAFEMSLTGNLALITLGGTISSDITFYNKNF